MTQHWLNQCSSRRAHQTSCDVVRCSDLAWGLRIAIDKQITQSREATNKSCAGDETDDEWCGKTGMILHRPAEGN